VIRSLALLLFAASLLALTDASPAAPAEPPAGAAARKDDAFAGRTKEGRARLLKEFGGSAEGEEAVMLGLAWLTQVQKRDGNWAYESGPHTGDHAAATGMAVLAFLGAGQSHKEGRFKPTVQAGLDWLVKNANAGQVRNRGMFNTITNMYSQGIAALALCEAYGMTRDPALKPAAQAAIDYIQKAQGPRGSWGYVAGTDNDTSILGWQIQALHAARLTQDLVVDDKVIERAIRFLNFVSPGQTKSAYGYSTPDGAQPATALTAIGLLCRYYINDWRRDTAGFDQGARGLMRRAPAPPARQVDMYYYYYATQVVRFYGGEEWKTWNEGAPGADSKRRGGLPDVLLGLQVRTPAGRGSWDPAVDRNETSLTFGTYCGRLGTTCMCLLTLEVYYRYVPEEAKDGRGARGEPGGGLPPSKGEKPPMKP
jgi:hypothetical protein